MFRIKDLFIETYRRKICIYNQDEVEYARIKFHSIFADNRIYALQAYNEDEKLKMMADYDHYFMGIIGTRDLSSKTHSTDSTEDGTKNIRKVTGKTGQLTGSVDAIQLGSVLDESERVIDTDKLPDFFDRNVRGYNQGVNVDDTQEDTSVTTTGNTTSDVDVTGSQRTQSRKGVDAVNQFRAHSLNVRRLREEFVQCFNVMFW